MIFDITNTNSHILEIMSDPYAEAIVAALDLQQVSHEPTWKMDADGPFTRAELESNKLNDEIMAQKNIIQTQKKIIQNKDAEIENLRAIISLIRITKSCP